MLGICPNYKLGFPIPPAELGGRDRLICWQIIFFFFFCTRKLEFLLLQSQTSSDPCYTPLSSGDGNPNGTREKRDYWFKHWLRTSSVGLEVHPSPQHHRGADTVLTQNNLAHIIYRLLLYMASLTIHAC